MENSAYGKVTPSTDLTPSAAPWCWTTVKEPPTYLLSIGDRWQGLVWMGKHWGSDAR